MRAILTAAAVLASTPAAAGDVTVVVTSQAGQPVRDAVVMVRAPGAAPSRPAGPLVMAQQNVSFQPYVLIVPLGATVAFPNRDRVRHHVYSFSPAKKFELKLYGRDESRTVTFDKPGPVSLGCNIHDRMIGFVYVTETPYAAKTGVDGVAIVRNVPAGSATLQVWHPDIRGRAAIGRPLGVTAAAQRAAAIIQLQAAITR